MPAVPLVGGARIPLAFIALGLVAFAAAALWLALEPTLLLHAYLHPRVVALVHLWVPGFILSVCFGAMYQLMPVVLGAALRAGDRMLWTHLALHAIGVSVMVGGFMTGRFGWVGIGGTLVATGVLMLGVTVARTFRNAVRHDAPAWSFPLATSWLVATVLLGVLLALHRRWSFLPLSAVDLLRAHAHLGLAGFFLTLLQGVTFQLVPMFTLGQAARRRLIWTGLVCTQIGLLLLAPGLAWGWRDLAIAGAGIVVFGVFASGEALLATLRTRRRKVLEPGVRAFAIGAAAIVVSAGVGLALLLAPNSTINLLALISLYGALIIAGALSLVVLGMLCKIMPFLVWMRSYGSRVGREPVPLATALASRRLELAWLCTHVLALALIAASCLQSSPALARFGTCALLVAIGLYLANAARILAHLRHARTS